MQLGHLFLFLRVIGMGLERPLVKRLSLDRDPTAVAVLYCGLGVVMFLLLLAARGSAAAGAWASAAQWLPWALLPGLLNAVCFFSFTRAMRVGEVSLLTPLFATCFVLMYVIDLGAGFAEPRWAALAGVLLVTCGVVFLSPGPPAPDGRAAGWWRYDPRWLLRQPGAGLMLLNAAAFACTRFFDKTFAPTADPLLYAAVVLTPTVLGGLLWLGWGSFWRHGGGLADLVVLTRERWGLALVLTVAGQGAFLALLYGLDYFPPSVIEPVTQLGVFIAIALGGLWFHEPVRARWLPSALVVAGAALLLA